MEEAALSTSFHADASMCGEALAVTLEQLVQRGTMTPAQAEEIMREFATEFETVLEQHLASETTLPLNVDGFMTQFNNLYEKWKIDADGVEIRSGKTVIRSEHSRLFFSVKDRS